MKYTKYISVVFVFSSCISVQDSQKPMSLIEGCQDGISRSGYTTPLISGDKKCLEGTQTCVGGEWIGPEIYERCENHTKSCGSKSHGTVVNGYLQPQSPSGKPCPVASRTCLNGAWVGPEVYATCSQR